MKPTVAAGIEDQVLIGDRWDLHYIVWFGAEGHRVTFSVCEAGANRAVGSCNRKWLPTL